MSSRKFNKGTGKKDGDFSQKKIVQSQNYCQKPPVVFHSISKPRPLLMDQSEFPSLSESTGSTSSCAQLAGGASKYSDKLKTQRSSAFNQTFASESLHATCDATVTDMYNQYNDKIVNTKYQRRSNMFKAGDNTKQIRPNSISDHSHKEFASSRKLEFDKKNKSTEQKRTAKIAANFTMPISVSNNVNKSSISSSQIQSNKSTNLNVENCELKEETDEAQCISKSKTKKRRKSKIKRQAALQAGKLLVLKPEIHYKIINQSSAFTPHNFKTMLGDINDEDEYPELGKARNHKECFLKKSIPSECPKRTAVKVVDLEGKPNISATDSIEGSLGIISDRKIVTEKKEKVHAHDPITVSFFDMLVDKTHKSGKETKESNKEDLIPTSIGLSKIKTKKNTFQPHNWLDSSSPAIKRGKERENPKPKKPSQLKKIILLDRKIRKEHLLQMKTSRDDGTVANDNESMLKSEAQLHESNEMDIQKESIDEYNSENDFLGISDIEENDDQDLFLLSENIDFDIVDGMEHLDVSEMQEIYNSNSLSGPKDCMKQSTLIENSTPNVPCNEAQKYENISHHMIQVTKAKISAEQPLISPRSPDSLLNSLIGNAKSEITDKERAAKILLHTRNFRQYCNHLISKDIDDVVFALLDDLARFQDRLHQKDPVKARMKKRMVYGVKEVKKHIKLRKLKCIIIAVDIENVETQGGLNDVLNDIKVSAVDHHIPCIFALTRKILGKICHKPVPVSCVGIFNYEGSEANFKKMVELQTQSRDDYVEIFNKLVMKLTDEEAETLFKTKNEAPEMLCTVRSDILNNFFQKSESLSNNQSADNQSIKIASLTE